MIRVEIAFLQTCFFCDCSFTDRNVKANKASINHTTHISRDDFKSDGGVISIQSALKCNQSVLSHALIHLLRSNKIYPLVGIVADSSWLWTTAWGLSSVRVKTNLYRSRLDNGGVFLLKLFFLNFGQCNKVTGFCYFLLKEVPSVSTFYFYNFSRFFHFLWT